MLIKTNKNNTKITLLSKTIKPHQYQANQKQHKNQHNNSFTQ